MGRKFTVEELTAAMLNAIGQPVKGDSTTGTGATSGTTESSYAQTPTLTPEPNTWYLVLCCLNFITGGAAASDGFWHRIRQDAIGGTEISVSRLDIAVNGGGPYADMHGGMYFSGSSPSAVSFLGTLQRFQGDSTLTPSNSFIMIIQCGGSADFT